MDMSNATAAGPSYGLLDVIFGSKPKEANEADGQGFGGLMELIKTLNKKEKDEDENPLDGNRTEQEMASGKSAIDYRAVGIPGLVSNVALFQIPELNSKNGETAPIIGEQASAVGQKTQSDLNLKSAFLQSGVSNSEKLEKIDVVEVNQLLKEKSLPALSEEEVKLLNDVNVKLEKAQAVASEKSVVLPKAAAAAQTVLDPKLKKELDKKGIVGGGKISSVETLGVNSVAPEKFMNTETYLGMHESLKSVGKSGTKEEVSDNKVASPSVALVNAAKEQNSEQAEHSGKEDLSGKTEHDVKSAKQSSKKINSDTAAFADALGQSVKGSNVAKKDVYLNSLKPEDVKTTLMGEVVQNVNHSAVKGGGEMHLIVHPEELGEVKIKVASKEGKIDVQISAKNEEVASLIRSGSKDLENSLGTQNLSLARFEVTVSDTAVVSTDTKSSLADQFLSQQNSSNLGNMQSNSNMADDRSSARWDGQSHRQQTAELFAEDQSRSSSHKSAARAKQNYSQRNGSQRLDVVA